MGKVFQWEKQKLKTTSNNLSGFLDIIQIEAIAVKTNLRQTQTPKMQRKSKPLLSSQKETHTKQKEKGPKSKLIVARTKS